MENKENITIETERLLLVPISMKYVQEIFKELTDEVTKYLRVPTPTKIEQEEEWILSAQEKLKAGIDINFVVTNEQWDFVGTCGFVNINTKTPEIGLWLKESARGKGYGKEMISTLINRLEINKDFDYIMYRAHVENIATRKIAECFGGELQRDEEGKELLFTEWKFDKSSSSLAVEYRIYKK